MLLRFIDTDGREQEASDIDGLYELIQSGRVGYESLVFDATAGRWVKAFDHPLFKRIREIAGQQAAAPPPPRALIVPSVTASPRETDVVPPPSAADPKAKTKTKWFAAITTRDEALKIIHDTAMGFFAVAGIQLLLGLFLMANSSNVGADVLIDVPLYAGLAAWLKWGRSRAAASLLLVAALVSAVTTVLGQLRIIDGGRNMVLAVIVLWAAVKAVEATFKLRGRFKDGGGAATAPANA